VLEVSKPMFNLARTMIGIALLQLAGCAATSNSANIIDVEIGMTQSQVLSMLGQPQKREAYGGTEFLFYVNEAGGSIPIAIVEGRVTSIGRSAYDVVVRSKAQSNTANAR